MFICSFPSDLTGPLFFLRTSLVEFLRTENYNCVKEVSLRALNRLTGLIRTMRLSCSLRNWAKKDISPLNSLSRPSTLLFSISIMKLSGPSLRWAEMTRSLYSRKHRLMSQLNKKILAVQTTSNLLAHREEDLHGVHPIAQVVLAHVNCLLLDYLLLLLCAIGTESLCIVTTVACVASLLEEGLITVGCAVLFFDNEVLTIDEGISYSTTFISAGEGFANDLAGWVG